MRFKREDMGLYFAMALIGGGVGLLVGAFVTVRVNKKREEETEELELEDAIEFEEVAEEEETVTHEQHITNITNEDLPPQRMKEVDDLIEKKRPRTSKRTRTRLSKENRCELARLTREYGVTTMQTELVESGVMTVKELEEGLIDAELEANDGHVDEDLEIEVSEINDIGHTDYNSPYRYNDSKPDMDDLLEKPIDDGDPRNIEDLLVVVDGRWGISIEPPIGKAERQKRTVYFDPEDESVFTKTADGGVTPADLRVITTPEVRDLIMPWLLFEPDMDTIYIDDIRNKKTRWYEIIRIGSEEDTSENDVSY